MDIFFQLIINGLLLGGAYMIISLGLTLIFGVVRVVNFAHGEFLMIGMYFVYLMAAHLGIHPYIGLVPAAIVLFGGGVREVNQYVSSLCLPNWDGGGDAEGLTDSGSREGRVTSRGGRGGLQGWPAQRRVSWARPGRVRKKNQKVATMVTRLIAMTTSR